MKSYERAAQIWPVLALAARNRQVLTYDTVGRLIGVPRFALGRHLEPIQSYCLLNHLPPLTVLVVEQVSGMPGIGFIAAQDIPRAQAQVFEFDWLKCDAPSPEVLESAVQKQPSNGLAAAAETATEVKSPAVAHFRSPRLADPAQAARLELEVIEENTDAGL